MSAEEAGNAAAAAFGRLCVETGTNALGCVDIQQPPSGGCVLKLPYGSLVVIDEAQPPSGGCVLKLNLRTPCLIGYLQPPSGGCVLKLC